MTRISNNMNLTTTPSPEEALQSPPDRLSQNPLAPANQDNAMLPSIPKTDSPGDNNPTFPSPMPLEPPPNNGVIDITQLLILFHDVDQQQRDAAMETRQAELTAQVSELNQSADDMRKAAGSAFAGALIMGIAEIGGGLASSIGGFSAANEGNEMTGRVTLAKWQGGSELIKSLGTFGKGAGDMGSSFKQSDSKKDDANATQLDAQRNAVIDFQNRMQQMMDETLQTLQQINQSQLDTARAILRV